MFTLNGVGYWRRSQGNQGEHRAAQEWECRRRRAAKEAQDRRSGDDRGAPLSTQPVQRAECPQERVQASEGGSDGAEAAREALVGMLYRLLDRDGDGELNSEEVMHLAGHKGFQGSEEEWDQVFALLCEDAGLLSVAKGS